MTKTTKISLNELFELQETMYKSYKKKVKNLRLDILYLIINFSG